MRHLTIKREKRYAACLVKIKVYIEDPYSRELEIKGAFCRKLGEIKNGEEKTFEIGENAARIFVIIDKMSKDFCCETYAIAEGTENIYLKGHNIFDLSSGNPFLFDDNLDPYAVELRARGKKKGRIFLISAIVLGFLVGFLISFAVFSSIFDKESPQTFTAGDMSITLTNKFSEQQYDDYDACFFREGENVGVLVLKEEKSLFEGYDVDTLDNYIDVIIEANKSTGKSGDIIRKDGLAYYIYDYYNSDDKMTYSYYTYFYESSDAFWMVQFVLDKKLVSTEKGKTEYEKNIAGWASSVIFK